MEQIVSRTMGQVQALAALNALSNEMIDQQLGTEDEHFMIAGYMSFVENTSTPEYTIPQALQFVARMRKLHGLGGVA